MGWASRRLFGTTAFAGILLGSASCTSLLGDFTIGAGTDASIDGRTDSNADDVSTDVVTIPDTSIPDTTPPCGMLNETCCPGAQCGPSLGCCGPTCIDIQSDPMNCGMCAHDCLGGGCVGGVCQPVVLGSTPDTDPTALVVDQQYAYFGAINGNKSALYQCDAVQGCKSGPTHPIPALQFAGDVIQTANDVWVTDFNASTVYAWSKQGQVSRSYSVPNPAGIAFAQNTIFVVAQSQVIQALPDLTSQLPLSGQEGADALATNGNGYLYWTRDGQSAIRFAKQGVQNAAFNWVDIAKQGSIPYGGIAANGQFVAWFTQEKNFTNSVWACADGSSCNSPTQLVSGVIVGNRHGNIAIDGTDVFWTAHDGQNHGQVFRCAAKGCAGKPTLVAQVPTSGFTAPGGIAVTPTHVFFLIGDAKGIVLYKVGKK